MNFKHIAVFISAVLLVSACATKPQRPIEFSNDASPAQSRVGIAVKAPQKAEMQYPGAGCLLCLAFAATSNTTLSRYVESLPKDDIFSLRSDLAEIMKKKGFEVVQIDDTLNFDSLPGAKVKGENLPTKDFTSFRDKYRIDKLLVIDISYLGMIRNYSSYIPTGDPQSRVSGTGYIVNLTDNTYQWYLPLNVVKGSDGTWDEPPSFPGLTNAYFQAIELSKDSVISALKN